MDGGAGRGRGAAVDRRTGAGGPSGLLPRRRDDRLQRRVRRQHRRLRGAGRGGLAGAAHPAPGERRAGGLDPRRRPGPVPLLPRQLLLFQPPVHGAGLRRLPGRATAADGRPRGLLAGRRPPGLRRDHPVAAGVEALPGRPGDGDLDRRPRRLASGAASPRRLQRQEPAVDRRHDLLPLRPRRRRPARPGEPVGLRHRQRRGPRGAGQRRARLQVGRRRPRRRDRRRALRRPAPLRSGDRRGARGRDHPRRRPAGGAPPFRRGQARADPRPRGSRPPARGRSSRRGGRSSPCRRRRATPATSPAPPGSPSAIRPGRPTAARSPTSPTPPASTPSTSSARAVWAR